MLIISTLGRNICLPGKIPSPLLDKKRFNNRIKGRGHENNLFELS